MPGSSPSNESGGFRSNSCPWLDQQCGQSCGDEQRDGDGAEHEGVAFGSIVDGAGGVGAEDGAPGVEEIHVAADRAEGFAAEEVATDAQKTRIDNP